MSTAYLTGIPGFLQPYDQAEQPSARGQSRSQARGRSPQLNVCLSRSWWLTGWWLIWDMHRRSLESNKETGCNTIMLTGEAFHAAAPQKKGHPCQTPLHLGAVLTSGHHLSFPSKGSTWHTRLLRCTEYLGKASRDCQCWWFWRGGQGSREGNWETSQSVLLYILDFNQVNL